MDWMESMMMESSPVTKRLHNFILPSNLRWGNQQHLDDEEIPAAAVDGRCFSSKEVSDSLHKRKRKEKHIYDPSPASSDFRRRSDFKKVGFDFKPVTFSPPPARKFKSSENGGDPDHDDESNGIAAVREKLMCDIRMAADKLIRNDYMETPVEEQYCSNNSSLPEKASSQEAKRASIRTVKGSEIDASNYTCKKKKNPRLRNNGGGATSKKEEMAKFTATVDKSELEEDIMALTGRRPNRRPKKRPRSVQTEIDSIYPGFWLIHFNADRYKVSEGHSRARR